MYEIRRNGIRFTEDNESIMHPSGMHALMQMIIWPRSPLQPSRAGSFRFE